MSGIAPALLADAGPVAASIDGLQKLYLIILALAIGEAFKQFVSDNAKTTK